MATSTQDMVRPGECVDLFYYDGKTSVKQCFPTTQNTKYVQQFNNLQGGSSVFTIPPNAGIQDIVCSFVLPKLDATDGSGVAIPRGWSYALIKAVSFRYGGSSQYFLSSDQILQLAMRQQPSRQTASDLFSFGGSYASGADLEAGAQYGAAVLPLPHNSVSGVGKRHPFPSDLLTQQIQITVELNSIDAIISLLPGASNPYTGLASATFQVQQVVFNNMGDALARRVDMADNAYAFGTEFVQQKQQINLTGNWYNNGQGQSQVLTGFRSGEVKAIHLWLSRTSDTAGTGIKNPNKWYLPLAVQMTYAGDIYARYDNATSPVWNLINGNKAPAFDTVDITDVAGAFVTSPSASVWVELPFAQTMLDEDSHYTLVHGKPITNGIVNLQIVAPTTDEDYILNVSYIYNTTLLFSQGTADYVF